MLPTWAKWFVTHNMKFILYIMLIIITPLYLLNYVKEACGDWIRDYKEIKRCTK